MATTATTTSSPYVAPDAIITSNMPISTIGPFDHGLFGPALDLTIAPFGLDPTCNFFTPDPNTYYHSPTPISESEVSAETFSSIPHTIELASPIRPSSNQSAFHPCTPEVPRRAEGLGIDALVHRTPASSPQPHRATIPSPSSTSLSLSRRYYAPIAPNPVGLRQLQSNKRALSEDETDSPNKKRKVSGSSSPAVTLEISDDDTFLLRLKDEEGLSWKDIASRFQTDLGKTVQIPALQMRLKRLRERMRVWTEMDTQALRMAYDYWLNSKFEIIASKMADFGAVEKWNAKQCNRKWQEIGYTHDASAFGQFTRTPTFSTSFASSPIEGSPHGFFPFVSTT